MMKNSEREHQHDNDIAPSRVGIDVRQAKLDIALRPAGSTWQVSNTDSGRQALRTWLSAIVPSLVT